MMAVELVVYALLPLARWLQGVVKTGLFRGEDEIVEDKSGLEGAENEEEFRKLRSSDNNFDRKTPFRFGTYGTRKLRHCNKMQDRSNGTSV